MKQNSMNALNSVPISDSEKRNIDLDKTKTEQCRRDVLYYKTELERKGYTPEVCSLMDVIFEVWFRSHMQRF